MNILPMTDNFMLSIRGQDLSIKQALFHRTRSRKERKMVKPKLTTELSDSAPHGVIFGKKGRKYATKPETTDGHVLVCGGAGSGKSSGIAIPTLQVWQERVFAIDIKGELYQKTKHKRDRIRVFNPSDPRTLGYDPFYILKGSRNPAQDAQEIALAIIPLSADVKEPFWVEAAQNLFTGALLHYWSLGYSFIQTIQVIQSNPAKLLVDEIMGGGYQLAKFYVAPLVEMDDRTISGVMSELSNKIMVFATDPDVQTALGNTRDMISPMDLENGYDVYICIEEHKLEQWRGLLTLIVNQFLKHFEKRADGSNSRILFLLDEFARLGKIEAVLNGLATLRSKGITIMPIIQSLAQLDLIYGQYARRAITDNCAYKAILSAADANTQEEFSKLVGTYDKTKKSHNANFEQYTQLGRGTGVSISDEEKRIIKPEDFGSLVDVILLTPYGFQRVKKLSCYKDKEFMILA